MYYKKKTLQNTAKINQINALDIVIPELINKILLEGSLVYSAIKRSPINVISRFLSH